MPSKSVKGVVGHSRCTLQTNHKIENPVFFVHGVGVAVTTALLPRGSRFGDIKLTGYLGSGGFSDVYAGQDSSGRRLAVKVLRLTGLNAAQQTQRVRREQEALARVDSRGVAKLISADLTADQPWIASEFVDGPTLKESIETQGPLTFDETLGLIRRLAEIVAELHELGIAHRDITPNNIIFGPDGPVLIDFGSARIDLENEATGSILLAGTPGFTPPEAEAGLAVGKKADVYALGQLAIYCLGNTDLPETLTQAKATDPNQRPSASQLANRLQHFNQALARQRSKVIQPLPTRFRPRVLAGVATLALLIGATGSYGVLRDKPVTTQGVLLLTGAEYLPMPSGGSIIDVRQLSEPLRHGGRRPSDTELGYGVGNLRSVAAWIEGAPQASGATPFGYGEVLVSVRELDPRVRLGLTSDGVLPVDVAVRVDRELDQLERNQVPDGCRFERAGTPLSLPGDLQLWGARTTDCFSDPRRSYSFFTAWHDEGHFVLSGWWEGNSQIHFEQLLTELQFDATAKVPLLDGSATWDDLDLVNDDSITLGSETVPFSNLIVDIPAQTSVTLTARYGADTQISMFVAGVARNDSGVTWTSAGRWWARSPAAQRRLSNTENHAVRFFLEGESLWEDAPISFELATDRSNRAPLLESWTALYDSLPLGQTYQLPSSRGQVFLLPTVPTTSTDWDVFDWDFTAGSIQIPVVTSQPVGTFDGLTGTQILLADDTKAVFELSYRELHDPHWMVTLAGPFEYLVSQAGGDWVMVGSQGNCSRLVQWEVPAGQALLEVSAGLSCGVADSYRFGPSGVSIPQAAPVFKVALLDVATQRHALLSEFVPGSHTDLENFNRFLEFLVKNGEAIVDAIAAPG